MLYTNADLFLSIAREHLRRLKRLKGPRTIGRKSSPHLRHALVCSVFSAFAVEHALTELIWSRCFFQVPKPYQTITLEYANSLRTVNARLDFLKVATRVPEDLAQDIRALFAYRNKIAHALVKPFEGKMYDFEPSAEDFQAGESQVLVGAELQKRIVEKDVKHLDLGGIGTPDIDIAAQNFAIAETALKALRSEMKSSQ